MIWVIGSCFTLLSHHIRPLRFSYVHSSHAVRARTCMWQGALSRSGVKKAKLDNESRHTHAHMFPLGVTHVKMFMQDIPFSCRFSHAPIYKATSSASENMCSHGSMNTLLSSAKIFSRRLREYLVSPNFLDRNLRCVEGPSLGRGES